MSKLIIGRWESPWPSEPYLQIRLAINVSDRKIVILHQFVEQSWIHFEASDDEYVRNAIADQLHMVIEDPDSYGMRRSDDPFGRPGRRKQAAITRLRATISEPGSA